MTDRAVPVPAHWVRFATLAFSLPRDRRDIEIALVREILVDHERGSVNADNPNPVPRQVMPPRMILTVLVCTGLILGSIAYVDRPVALFMHAQVHARFILMAMVAIGNIPVPLASGFLVYTVIAYWCGVKPGAHGGLMMTLAIATLVALVMKDQLKFVFGRVWPESHPIIGVDNYPSFISNHVFGFFPFHGGTSYGSFPSGHATAITTPMAVLWAKVPRYRVLWAGLILVVAAGLIAADFHFVSDVMAGFFLGMTVAAGSMTLIEIPEDKG